MVVLASSQTWTTRRRVVVASIARFDFNSIVVVVVVNTFVVSIVDVVINSILEYINIKEFFGSVSSGSCANVHCFVFIIVVGKQQY